MTEIEIIEEMLRQIGIERNFEKEFKLNVEGNKIAVYTADDGTELYFDYDIS